MEWHHIGLVALGLFIGALTGSTFSSLGNKIKREEETYFMPQYDRRKNTGEEYHNQFKPIRREQP